LRRLERPVTPRDVKRAVDYIEANLDAEIGLPEIVATCGVPGRTLIKHFTRAESSALSAAKPAANSSRYLSAGSLAAAAKLSNSVAASDGRPTAVSELASISRMLESFSG
jgi:AraC-like DNA-binding protein